MCLNRSTDRSSDRTSNEQLLDVIDIRSHFVDDNEKSVNVVRTSGRLNA